MHAVESSTNFNESMYFNAFDIEQRVGGFIRLGNRVNEGYAEMTVCLYQPDGTVAFAFARPEIHTNDVFDAGGARFEVLTPFEELTTTFTGKACLLSDPMDLLDPRQAFRTNPWVEVNLNWRHHGLVAPYGGELVNTDGEPLAEANPFARGHYEQHMAVTGTTRIGAHQWSLSGFGLRDHSWGPRHWSSPWWYRWLTGNFGPQDGFVLSKIAQRDGTFTYGGVIFREGTYEHIRSCEVHTTWDSEHRQRSITATAVTSNHNYRIHGRAHQIVPLRHRRKDEDGTAHFTRITEAMTEWHADHLDATGWGMAEYLDQIEHGRPVGMLESDAIEP